jgi:hypothetical protein
MLYTKRTSGANVFGLASYCFQTMDVLLQQSSVMGHNSISRPDMGFGGWFSTTTNTNVIIGGLYMPATIDTSAMTNSGGASQWMRPLLQLYRVSTA